MSCSACMTTASGLAHRLVYIFEMLSINFNCDTAHLLAAVHCRQIDLPALGVGGKFADVNACSSL